MHATLNQSTFVHVYLSDFVPFMIMHKWGEGDYYIPSQRNNYTTYNPIKFSRMRLRGMYNGLGVAVDLIKGKKLHTSVWGGGEVSEGFQEGQEGPEQSTPAQPVRPQTKREIGCRGR